MCWVSLRSTQPTILCWVSLRSTWGNTVFARAFLKQKHLHAGDDVGTPTDFGETQFLCDSA